MTILHVGAALHPGEVLIEYLGFHRWTPRHLAELTKLPIETVQGVCDGTAPITEEIATELEAVLHRPKGWWLRLQANYDRRRIDAR